MKGSSMLHHLNRLQLSIVFLILFVSAGIADVTKQPLDHSDYDRWNTISTFRISNDGQWILYAITSGKADAEVTLVIRKNGGPKEYRIARGNSAKFTFDSKFVIYKITPDSELTKKLKKEKTKSEDMPKPVMEVLELATGESFRADRIQSFSIPEENGLWLAYLLEKPLSRESVEPHVANNKESYEVTREGLRRPAKPLTLKKRTPETSIEEKEPTVQGSKSEEKPTEKDDGDNDDSSDKKEKEVGTVLAIRNLATNEERRFPNVVNYQFSKKGEAVAFVTSVESSPDKKQDEKEPKDPSEAADTITDGVYILDLKYPKLTQATSGLGEYKNLTFNKTGDHLAFVTNKNDYDSKTPGWSLYHWKKPSSAAKLIASEHTEGIPNGWWVSSDAKPYFSEDGRRMFFFTAPVPKTVIEERKEKGKEEPKKDDHEKKAKLDIWHWQDPLLQPEQLLQADKEKSRSYVAVYDLEKTTIRQLADKEHPSLTIDRRSSANNLAVGINDLPYRKQLSWDRPGLQDTHLIHLESGERTAILKNSRARGTLSPEGKFITWFDPEDRQWYAASTGPDRSVANIGKGIGFPLQDELHDTPSVPNAYRQPWLAERGCSVPDL